MHAEVLLKFFYHAALSEECLHHLMAFNNKRIQTCKMFRLLTKLQYMTIKLKKKPWNNTLSTTLQDEIYTIYITYILN